MASGRTLAVVRSLNAAGFQVWTPTGMKRIPRPRSTKYRDEQRALMTCFAFAPYEDAPRLAAIVQAPVQEHPAFSLLMYRDTYGRVPDASLQGLRDFEVNHAEEWATFVATEEADRLERLRKKKNKRKIGTSRLNAARSYVMGQTVRVEGTAFTSLTARVVENKRNGELVIEFDGSPMTLTVEACDVRPVHVNDAQPEQAPVTG